MLAKQGKNGVLSETISNVIDPTDVLRLTDSTNVALLISKLKFADRAMLLSSGTEVSSCFNSSIGQSHMLIELRHLNQ